MIRPDTLCNLHYLDMHKLIDANWKELRAARGLSQDRPAGNG